VLRKELRHRPQAPLHEGGRLHRQIRHLELGAAQSIALLGDVVHDVEDGTQPLHLVGECLVEAFPVTLPVARDAKGQIREDESRVAVGIQWAEDDPLGEAETVQDLRDESVSAALADVVDPHIELVGVVLASASKYLGVAAGHVVGLQNQGSPAQRRQVRRRREPSQS
jgi:hypothetical protein